MPSYRNLQILSASLFIVGLLQISWAHFFAPYFSEDFVLIEKSELENLKLRGDLDRIEDLDQNETITWRFVQCRSVPRNFALACFVFSEDLLGIGD